MGSFISSRTHPEDYYTKDYDSDDSDLEDKDGEEDAMSERSDNSWTEDQVISLRLISFKKFKASGEFPRFPTDDQMVTEMPRKDVLNSFVVFISHAWLRGHPGSEGYEKLPHPDNQNHEKYRLCVEGIEKIRMSDAFTFDDIWIWLDFGCLNQNRNPTETFHLLPDIIFLSDCLFTPIVDHDGSWLYEKTTFGMMVDYKADAFQTGQYAYINRAWCRLEMFLASNLPLKNPTMRDCVYERMKLAALDGRRPHFLYGSKESVDGNEPLEIPPMENTFFDKYSPLRGYLSRPEDEPCVAALVQTNLVPLMARVKPCYYGPRNKLMQKHGRGRCVEESGDVYDGEYVASRKQGKGKMSFANGQVYVGDWKQNLMYGKGRMIYPNRDVYEGDWVESDRHGFGKCVFADGSSYEGEWVHGVIHGHGIYQYKDKSVYEGDFVQAIKEGVGTLHFSNKDIYSGDWKGGYMHGKGVYQHNNGAYYDGDWLLDKKTGHGKYSYPNGSVYEGEWLDGKKHGFGILLDRKGGRFEGEWKKGVWKG